MLLGVEVDRVLRGDREHVEQRSYGAAHAQPGVHGHALAFGERLRWQEARAGALTTASGGGAPDLRSVCEQAPAVDAGARAGDADRAQIARRARRGS